jgi:hypothetical protein
VQNAEKTVIGDIPVLNLGDTVHEPPVIATHSAFPRPGGVATRKPATRIPPDRWVLLAISIATLGYSLRTALPLQPPTIAAKQLAPTPIAPTTSFYSMRPLEPPTLSGVPLDAAALETAAAHAWLAGHTTEAALLYQQLAALSPEAPPFTAAATILGANLTTTTTEVSR